MAPGGDGRMTQSATEWSRRIAIEALEEIASEECTYIDCAATNHREIEPPADLPYFDPECPGEVCTARKALYLARLIEQTVTA